PSDGNREAPAARSTSVTSAAGDRLPAPEPAFQPSDEPIRSQSRRNENRELQDDQERAFANSEPVSWQDWSSFPDAGREGRQRFGGPSGGFYGRGFGGRFAPPERSIDLEHVERGSVVWDGTYLRPPYAVTEDGEEICLNGRQLPPLSELSLQSHTPRFLGRRPDPSATRADGDEQDSVGDRRRGSRPLVNGDLHHLPARATTVGRALDRGGLVLVHHDVTYLLHHDDAHYVLCALRAEPDASVVGESLQHYFQSPRRAGTDVNWPQVAASFASRDALQHLFPAIPLAEPDTALPFGVTTRAFRYGMTLLGMGLGVFGFGMLLQHRPHVRCARDAQDGLGEGFQLLPCYVILVVVFAAFDLACTMFADSSGGLLELNPLGNSLLSSPLTLVATKSLATLGSATILFRLRPYRIAQVTAWWLCLICVMLTFRWVVFNSMFMT
ncbi:MAG: hypothetical protein AB7F89_09965, partial [Pirellulaceae bacterium]